MTQIAADGLVMQHPVRLATGKAAGTPVGVDTPIGSILSDNSGNRICIEEDGSLSLYFDRNLLPSGRKVALLPQDSALPKMEEPVTDYDSAATRVCFEGVLPGEYQVMIR